MSFKIFYSWQSKRDKKYCMFFIQDCLKEVVKKLNREFGMHEPEFIIDRDTKNVPGYPNIPTTIEAKIIDCDVFVGDLTLIGVIDKEGMINQNVNNELGFALGSIGSERIVTVMNTAYGNSSFPFDLAQRRNPIQFDYTTINEENKAKIKGDFVAELYSAIKLVFTTQLERRKKEYYPFDTYNTWDEVFPKNFEFENNDYFDQLFSEIRKHIVDEKSIYRFVGLAGLGKTRLLLECFRNNRSDNTSASITNRILYVNLNENEESNINETIKNLIRSSSNKILIIDNCSASYHYLLSKIIRTDHSKLSLITIGIDPDERIDKSDPEGFTKLIILESLQCKDIIRKILKRNFKELLDDEVELLVEFSNGLAVIAAIMGNNKERGKHQPGSLQEQDLLERLLGELYTDIEQRKVLLACSLFSRFGFFDDLSYQIEIVAESDDLCNLNLTGVHENDIKELRVNRVKSVCTKMHERQLLEKVGRTFAFRPTPLAVKMAEEWWKDCTTSKFDRLIPILKKGNLVESFCQQFQYLKHLEQARSIVEKLCGGVFSSAEVLNTEEGSRLFRSFVIVNPQACVVALQHAFGKLSIEEIKEIKTGRRNLVWALEKLCFRNETFIESSKILSWFAAGENENIGNNATAQFVQLFHIYLPATSANYNDRWTIIEYLFSKNNRAFDELGLSAISHSLIADRFSRMGGAEDQGDKVPLKEYEPKTFEEIYSYWSKASNKLTEFVVGGNSNLKERSIQIIKSKFAQLSLKGGASVLWITYKELVENGEIDRLTARENILWMLGRHDVYISVELRHDLNKFLQFLQPLDFKDFFSTYVIQPSSEDYFNQELELDGQKLGKKVNEIAQQFSTLFEDWRDLMQLLVSGHISEGYNFGFSLGSLLSSDISKSKTFINYFITEIENLELEKINLSVLIGFIVSVNNNELKISLFNSIANNAKLYPLSFIIATRIDLPYESILKLFELFQEKQMNQSVFLNFKYGWGLKHLNIADALKIVEKIYALDDSSALTAFLVLATWKFDNPNWDSTKHLFRKMLIEKGATIEDNLRDLMDRHYWSEILNRLLKETTDYELCQQTLEIIIKSLSEFEGFSSKRSEFYKLLDTIQERYFEQLWETLVHIFSNMKEYGFGYFHLKDLLGSKHDYYSFNEGLLFKDREVKFEIILDWCKKNQDDRLHWIAELIPIFKKDEEDQQWIMHPYAKKFIDELGFHQTVISAISAHMGSYSWVGSVVPFLEMKKKIFEELSDHKFSNVKDWALNQLAYVNEEIRKEKNRAEEGF